MCLTPPTPSPQNTKLQRCIHPYPQSDELEALVRQLRGKEATTAGKEQESAQEEIEKDERNDETTNTADMKEGGITEVVMRAASAHDEESLEIMSPPPSALMIIDDRNMDFEKEENNHDYTKRKERKMKREGKRKESKGKEKLRTEEENQEKIDQHNTLNTASNMMTRRRENEHESNAMGKGPQPIINSIVIFHDEEPTPNPALSLLSLSPCVTNPQSVSVEGTEAKNIKDAKAQERNEKTMAVRRKGKRRMRGKRRMKTREKQAQKQRNTMMKTATTTCRLRKECYRRSPSKSKRVVMGGTANRRIVLGSLMNCHSHQQTAID